MADYDPFSSAHRDDLYPAWAALRETAPVHCAPASGTWCVSRYDDVSFVLKQPDLFSSSAMQEVLMQRDLGPITPRYVYFLLKFLWKTKINPFAVQRSGNLVSMDPPRHDAIRNVVNRGFTPKRIAAWEGRAREVVADQLRQIDRMVAHGDTFDAIDDIAIPLPVTIIAEMLGIEPERHADFKRWSDAIITVASGTEELDLFESGVLDVFGELFGYLRETVIARRREPRDDLISVLVDPKQESVMSELDMVQFVVLLLVAGNETTTNLIGNAVTALLDNPQTLARVAADPALVPAVIEETLRFDTPVPLVLRKATVDVEIADRTIPKGAIVTALIGSANHDAAHFDRPELFDIDRDTRGHLGFGLGIHFCLGSSLARLEARVALEALVPELPRFKPAGPRNELIDSFLVRGRRHIPLAGAAG